MKESKNTEEKYQTEGIFDKGTKWLANLILNGASKLGDFVNTLATSGGVTDFGQTSPFVDIDRQKVHDARIETTDKAKEQIANASVLFSPSSHVVSWFNGSINPYKGAEIISKADPRLQLLALGSDIVLYGKAAKSIISKNIPSELDWSGWFKTRSNGLYDAEDIAALQKHIPEYLKIERKSKSNGTWLKMPDGSTWKGDPRSWVQLMSKDGLSKQVWWHGDDLINPTYNDILWGSSEPHIARSYASSDKGVVPFVLQSGKRPLKQIDANGNLWKSAYKEGDQYYSTNVFSKKYLKDGEYLIINNVIDKGSRVISPKSKYYIEPKSTETFTDYLIRNYKGNDVIIGKNTIRKYLVGNNGNFDFSNPNVYKLLIPGMIYGISRNTSK